MPVSSSYISCATGPVLPPWNCVFSPLTVMDPTGTTTTAVPQQKHSSASSTSSTETFRSSTVNPFALAMSMMDLRVMPGRMLPPSAGVAIVLPLTQKKLHEDTSSMYLFSTASR